MEVLYKTPLALQLRVYIAYNMFVVLLYVYCVYYIYFLTNQSLHLSLTFKKTGIKSLPLYLYLYCLIVYLFIIYMCNFIL